MSKPGIGALLPHAGYAASASAMRAMVQGAEALGVDSLWVGDHVILPEQQESEYPYRAEGDSGAYEVPSARPYLEAFQSLAFAAACSRTIGLGLSVGIAPYRHPLLWAKSIGTLSMLAEGRIRIGVGAGWMEEEFRALGVDFAERGRLADEVLDVLRRLWADDQHQIALHGDGELVHVVPAFHVAPPPVWIGGNGKVALRRTAQFGDVWHPHVRGTPPAKVTQSLAQVAEMAEERGRTTSGTAALLMGFALDAAVGPPAWDTGRLVGPASYCAEVLAEYAEVGVEHVVLAIGGRTQRRLWQLGELLSACEAVA